MAAPRSAHLHGATSLSGQSKLLQVLSMYACQLWRSLHAKGSDGDCHVQAVRDVTASRSSFAWYYCGIMIS